MIRDIPSEHDFHRSAARFLESAWSDVLAEVEAEAYYREIAKIQSVTIDDFEFDAEPESTETDPPAGGVDSGAAPGDAEPGSEPTETDLPAGGAEPGAALADAEGESGPTETDPPDSSQSKENLAVAYISAYTGVEHLLRARIAKVSPFLLIAGSVANWPAKDIAFADFKTIDAQDLIRAHDTIANDAERLPDDFKKHYEELRRRRNSMVHSHASISVATKDLIHTVLWAVHLLVGPRAWIEWRRKALSAVSRHDESFSWNSALRWELSTALNSLGAQDCEMFLGIRKKNRRYLCPVCLANRSRDEKKAEVSGSKVAQLDKSETTLLRCVVCEKSSTVQRRDCGGYDCKGNVIATVDGHPMCMTCGEFAEPEMEPVASEGSAVSSDLETPEGGG